MKFVPYACRWETVPCHHIRLNEAHETIDSLCRTATQEELEAALREWLHATIEALEDDQVQTREPPDRSAATKGGPNGSIGCNANPEGNLTQEHPSDD